MDTSPQTAKLQSPSSLPGGTEDALKHAVEIDCPLETSVSHIGLQN